MKHLTQFITEGDIKRVERKYREFCNMCKHYDPNVDMKEVWVKKTVKNNWAVHHGLKKLFTASILVIDDEVIEQKGIKVCKESMDEDDFLTEAYKDKLHKYTITYLQYDPDVQADYEDGDASEDDLHDSATESDVVKPLDIGALDDSQALRKAEKIIKKEVNNHSELCGGSVSRDGETIDTIFI